VVLDEYGSTSGIITLSDILRGILGDFEVRSLGIKKLSGSAFLVKGSMPVEEINDELDLDLPERKDYTTLSGLFIYEYGRLPLENARVQVKNILLVAKKMGRRKIEEVVIIGHEAHRPE
jgi:CBS domain containing-hemolysin-like protein